MSKQESFECDGHIRKIKSLNEIQVGMVLRDINPDGSFAPFSDMVVYKITYSRIGAWQTNTHFHLARPYAHSHGEQAMVRVEQFDSHTLEYKRLVLNAAGKPYLMKLD